MSRPLATHVADSIVCVIYTLLRVVIDVFQTAYLAFKEQIVENLLIIESFQSHRIRALVVSAVPLQRA